MAEANGTYNSEGGDNIDKGGGEKNGKNKKDKDKDKKEEPAIPPVPYLHLFRFATTRDKFLAIVAFLAAAVCGASMPLMVIFFGRVTDVMVNDGMNLTEICPDRPPEEEGTTISFEDMM